MEKLLEFKNKAKFIDDPSISKPGISDKTLIPHLTEKVNLIADDFKNLVDTGTATDEDYQDKINIGLQRFSDVYLDLDTEDREIVCSYVEELMDIVGLESSGGHLNHFMYEFDPNKK